MADSRQVGRLTISYTIEAGGSMTTDYDTDGDLPLVTQLGLLRLAEDTAIRQAMEPDSVYELVAAAAKVIRRWDADNVDDDAMSVDIERLRDAMREVGRGLTIRPDHE